MKTTWALLNYHTVASLWTKISTTYSRPEMIYSYFKKTRNSVQSSLIHGFLKSRHPFLVGLHNKLFPERMTSDERCRGEGCSGKGFKLPQWWLQLWLRPDTQETQSFPVELIFISSRKYLFNSARLQKMTLGHFWCGHWMAMVLWLAEPLFSPLTEICVCNFLPCELNLQWESNVKLQFWGNLNQQIMTIVLEGHSVMFSYKRTPGEPTQTN